MGKSRKKEVAYERVAQKLVEAGGGEAVLSRAFGGLALAGGGAGQGGREPRPEAPAGDESEDDDAADRISALLDALELVDGWEVSGFIGQQPDFFSVAPFSAVSTSICLS